MGGKVCPYSPGRRTEDAAKVLSRASRAWQGGPSSSSLSSATAEERRMRSPSPTTSVIGTENAKVRFFAGATNRLSTAYGGVSTIPGPPGAERGIPVLLTACRPQIDPAHKTPHEARLVCGNWCAGATRPSPTLRNALSRGTSKSTLLNGSTHEAVADRSKSCDARAIQVPDGHLPDAKRHRALQSHDDVARWQSGSPSTSRVSAA